MNKRNKRIRNLKAFVNAYLKHKHPLRDNTMTAAFRKAAN